MSILDFGKFNIDNGLTQNKSLFGNYSSTNKGYEDSKTTDFNNMIDKINSKSKALEPENKINTNSNTNLNTSAKSNVKSVVDKKTQKVNIDKKIINNANQINKSTVVAKDRTTSINLSQTSNLALKSETNSKEIELEASIDGNEGSLINDELVRELENLLNEYSDIDITSSDLKEQEFDLNIKENDLLENVNIDDNISNIIDNVDELAESENSQNLTPEQNINVYDNAVADNITLNVQDVIVKDDLVNYSDDINVNEIDASVDLKNEIDVASNLVTNQNNELKNTEINDKQINDFTKFLNRNDNDVIIADKKDTIVQKNDSKLLSNEKDVNYENQDLQDVINLDETVEVSDAVKNMSTKINTNKNSKENSLNDVKISKKDLEELKVKIEEISFEETSSSGEFQSNQQTAQEDLIKLSIDGIDSLTKNHKPENLNVNFAKVLNQTNTKELSQENIVSQIYSKLQNMHQGSKMVMTLNPESLGKVQVELVNSKTGLIAQMSVTNNAVKDILSKDIDGLRAALNSQGITVDSINIKLDENSNDSGKNDYLDQEKNKDNKEQGFSKNKKDENERKEQQKLFENLFETISEENIKE